MIESNKISAIVGDGVGQNLRGMNEQILRGCIDYLPCLDLCKRLLGASNPFEDLGRDVSVALLIACFDLI